MKGGQWGRIGARVGTPVRDSNVGCRMLNVGCQMSNIECQKKRIKEESNMTFKRQKSRIKKVSDAKHISDVVLDA